MHTVSNGYKNCHCRRPEKKQQINSKWNKVQGYRIIGASPQRDFIALVLVRVYVWSTTYRKSYLARLRHTLNSKPLDSWQYYVGTMDSLAPRSVDGDDTQGRRPLIDLFSG